MNFLNSLLIGSAEWSLGPWTAGPLDEGDGAEGGGGELAAGRRRHEKGLGSNSRHQRPSESRVHEECILPQETHLEASPGDGVSRAKRQVPSLSF